MPKSRSTSFRPRIDGLEVRQLLSTTAGAAAKPTLTDLKDYYGLTGLTFPSASGATAATGAGETIVIISGSRDQTATSSDRPGWSNSSLARFSRANGLPAGALGSADPVDFEMVNEYGDSKLPKASTKRSGEFDLDTQAVHAFAPGAKIIDIVLNSTYPGDVNQGFALAISKYSPAAISYSYSGPEHRTTLRDPLPDANGTTYVQSAGDSGTGYQVGSDSSVAFHHLNRYDPLTVIVGGTILTKVDGRFHDVAWGNGANSGDKQPYQVDGISFGGGSGGGFSQYTARPAYQADSAAVRANQASFPAASAGQRLGPDLSLISLPGLEITAYNPGKEHGRTIGFQTFRDGGTSLSAPLFAGIMAVVDQGRALAGRAALSSSDTLREIYRAPESDFRDIVDGNNGYPALPGYDLASGRGAVQLGLIRGLIAAPATTVPKA